MNRYAVSCTFENGAKAAFQVFATNYANAIKKAKEKIPDGRNFRAEEVSPYIHN